MDARPYYISVQSIRCVSSQTSPSMGVRLLFFYVIGPNCSMATNIPVAPQINAGIKCIELRKHQLFLRGNDLAIHGRYCQLKLSPCILSVCNVQSFLSFFSPFLHCCGFQCGDIPLRDCGRSHRKCSSGVLLHHLLPQAKCTHGYTCQSNPCFSCV